MLKNEQYLVCCHYFVLNTAPQTDGQILQINDPQQRQSFRPKHFDYISTSTILE